MKTRWLLIFFVMAAWAPPSRADVPADSPEEARLIRAVSNPDSATWAAGELKRMLRDGEVEPNERGIAWNLISQALMVGKAPVPAVIGAADSAVALLGSDPGDRAQIHAGVGDYLEEHGDLAGAEARYRQALRAVAGNPNYGYVRAMARNEIARFEMTRGATAQALVTLDSALVELPPDNINLRQRVLISVGTAHEKQGNVDQAIDAYLQSAGTFLGQDSSAIVPLRALWAKKNGSLAGLDAKLAATREASKQKIVFDARRFEQLAPRWTLNDLTGKPISLAAYKGKVVVLDFWGSWCAPCRQELPHLQETYQRYRSKGVEFATVNVEMVDTAAEHQKIAADFMKTNGYTFPVAIDQDGVAVQAHNVDSYPTVFVIDRTGKIRFRNKGYTDGISEILGAQIDLLLSSK